MILRKIYQQLGLEPKYEEEVKKLNNRIVIAVDNFYSDICKSKNFRETSAYDYIYPSLIKEFAFLMGESKYYGFGISGRYYLELQQFFKNDGGEAAFNTNVKNLTLLLEATKTVCKTHYKDFDQFLLNEVKRVFDTTPIDIGYLFTGETIIKKGAKELDEKLILENLSWLVKYPRAKEFFENALNHYLTKNYPDAITNAYSSLESLVKTYLNRDKRLDDNEIRAELVKNLGLETDWGQLLHYYCKLTHEFSSRHGKKETGEISNLSPELIEFYIYLTGTFIRLIIQRDIGKTRASL